MNTVNVGRYHTEDEGESDIDAGKKWSREIDQQLDATKIGVLGLTRQNLAQPWILFEAGALAKQVESDTSRVTPYLFDVSPTELVVPLSSFQAATADKDGTKKLVRSLNAARCGRSARRRPR